MPVKAPIAIPHRWLRIFPRGYGCKIVFLSPVQPAGFSLSPPRAASSPVPGCLLFIPSAAF